MRSTLVRLALAALIVALGSAAGVRAQEQTTEFTSWRVPGWSFTPRLSVGGVFDSNVALASAPADTRRTEADRLVIIEPGAQLEFLSARTDFSTGYRGYLRRHVDVRELDGFDQQGYLSLRRLASRRVTVFVNNTYTVAPTTDEVELNGVPFSRTGVSTNNLAAGVETRLTRHTDFSTRYDLTWVDFETDDSLTTLGPGTGTTGTLGTSTTPRTNFLRGGYVNGLRTELRHSLAERVALGAEYAVRLADINEGTRELLFQDAGGTLRVVLGPTTTFTAAAGMSYMNDRTLDDTRTGPYYRTGITHETERVTVGAGFERTFVPSFGFGGSSDTQELRAFVRMPVHRNRLYVQLMTAWRRSDPFIAGELGLDTLRFRTTAGYAATRWLRLEGFHAYTRQDSVVTGGEIDRQRIGAQIVISQPMRIR